MSAAQPRRDTANPLALSPLTPTAVERRPAGPAGPLGLDPLSPIGGARAGHWGADWGVRPMRSTRARSILDVVTNQQEETA